VVTMRFTLQSQKLVLSAATGICLAAAPLVLVWGCWPLQTVVSGDDSVAPGARTANPAPVGPAAVLVPAPPRDVWTKRLRRPLYDPPAPQVVEQPLAPLQVALKGTILEPGNSMAIIASPDGTIDYKRVGDPLGPAAGRAHVKEILSDSVVVERENKTETLKVTE
jgi:hypothetical protein